MATRKPATYHCPATRWRLDDLVAALPQQRLQPLSRSSIWRILEKELQRGVQRRAFLCDPTHQHGFHFTPIHGSWLHQVALWLSVLARRFLQRGDDASAHDFDPRLTNYLEVYNTHHAHPYRWTYTG
jgi:hypothetical protein